MQELEQTILSLFNRFKINTPYNPILYDCLINQGKIYSPVGEDRKRIINLANRDVTECKRILMQEYFEKRLKDEVKE